MAKLDRLLALVHVLSETTEGLTLEDMADRLGVNRPAAERMASAADRACGWRFHRLQQIEELANGGLRVRFSSGGMRELAKHLFSWGGDLEIEGPDILAVTMRDRLAAAATMLSAPNSAGL